MWTLRLVLIALGVAFVAGLYFYTRRHPPGRRGGRKRLPDPAGAALHARKSVEPRWTAFGDNADSKPAVGAPAADAQRPPAEPLARATAPAVSEGGEAARLFALAVRLTGEGTAAAAVTQTLLRLGCVPRDGIYRYAPGGGEALYSVADLFEPGTLAPLPPDRRLRGLVFFFQAAPGRETAARLHRMLGAAHECAVRLEGRVEDQSHRPLTAARELEIKLAAAGDRNPS